MANPGMDTLNINDVKLMQALQTLNIPNNFTIAILIKQLFVLACNNSCQYFQGYFQEYQQDSVEMLINIKISDPYLVILPTHQPGTCPDPILFAL